MPLKESPRITRPPGDGAESVDRAAADLDLMARQHQNGASLTDLVVQSGLVQPTVLRQREHMMKMRTMQVNALRGLLYEFGAIFAKGHKARFGEMEQAFVDLSAQLPRVVVDSLREQVTHITALARTWPASKNVWRCNSKTTRTCCVWPIHTMWACSRPRRPSPPLDRQVLSSLGESFVPGWGWFPRKRARAVKCDWITSASAVTPTCAPCSFTGSGVCSVILSNRGTGLRASRTADRPTW